MKQLFGSIIIFSGLILVGCATPLSEYDKARKINSIDSYRAYINKYPSSRYTKEAKDKISEFSRIENRKIQIKKNWGKLSKGMSVDEVDHFIGPLNRGAVRSIKYIYENKNASLGMRNTPNSESGYPYHGHYFTLHFDATGKLSTWSLKKIK